MTGQSVLPVTIPYECIGISDTDLESGGGSCIVTCPDSCTIISGVEKPCSGSSAAAPGPTPYTQYDCPSGSYCTLSTKGGLCEVIDGTFFASLGIPDGFYEFMNRKETDVPRACIGIENNHLESGGGNCIMTCPESCNITYDVEYPCSVSSPTPPGPTPIQDIFGFTQFDCPSGSYCTISTNGGFCSVIGETNDGPFIANIGDAKKNYPVPHACIGIENNHLESGGGNCIMTCPDTCTITYNKFLPCSGSSPAIRAFSSLIVAFAGIGAAFQYILV